MRNKLFSSICGPLLLPDPSDGGPTPEPSPTPQPGGPDPTPPPAAKVVASGKTESEISLAAELKKREQRIAELEDQNQQLKTVTKPAAKKKDRVRFVLLDHEDED